MHLYVHVAASAFCALIFSMLMLDTVNLVVVGFAILGALVLDFDHVLVIFTQRNAFTLTARELFKSRNLSGAIKHLASIERKGIGVMYAHNFISMSVVVLVLIVAVQMNLVDWIFFLGVGVLLHMILDVLDDLFTIKSFRNWMLRPRITRV